MVLCSSAVFLQIYRDEIDVLDATDLVCDLRVTFSVCFLVVKSLQGIDHHWAELRLLNMLATS